MKKRRDTSDQKGRRGRKNERGNREWLVHTIQSHRDFSSCFRYFPYSPPPFGSHVDGDVYFVFFFSRDLLQKHDEHQAEKRKAGEAFFSESRSYDR